MSVLIDLDELREAYNKGEKVDALAIRYNTTTQTIFNKLKKAGVNIKAKGRPINLKQYTKYSSVVYLEFNKSDTILIKSALRNTYAGFDKALQERIDVVVKYIEEAEKKVLR
jgi:hypothetical protein